ncbi:MAG: hypothetical protein HKN70_03865 [Gammaproteobacteria bacterium]|nr:hypothetical protein [Gammaproteobacteria bacterium]
MPSTFVLRSTGLIMLGFIIGIIVSGLGKTSPQPRLAIMPAADYSHTDFGSRPVVYEPLASSGYWDVVSTAKGRQVALGRDGRVRVVVIADKDALHVMAYGQDKSLWEGRLVDFDGDGSIEIADISGGHCENFEH